MDSMKNRHADNFLGHGFLFTGLFFILSLLIITFGCTDQNDSVDDIIKEGNQLIEEFEFNEAIKLFSKSLKENETNDRLQYYLGESIRLRLFYSRFKEFSENKKKGLMKNAEKAYLTSKKLNPEIGDAYIGLARLYAYDRHYDNALHFYKKALSKETINHEIYKEIGNIYLKMNKTDLAKSYFSLSEKKAPSIIGQGSEFVLNLKDNMRFNGKKKEVNGKITWKVADALIFNARVPDVNFGEKIIYETFIANLSKHIKMNNNFCLGDDTNNRKAEIIKKCNIDVLLEYGMEIKNFTISMNEK